MMAANLRIQVVLLATDLPALEDQKVKMRGFGEGETVLFERRSFGHLIMVFMAGAHQQFAIKKWWGAI